MTGSSGQRNSGVGDHFRNTKLDKLDLSHPESKRVEQEVNGRTVTYDAPGIPPDTSFLERLDIVNAKLGLAGEEPIASDHEDSRNRTNQGECDPAPDAAT